MLTTIESSSHWYSREGKPRHSVIGTNGNERSTTLRDARKLDLLPSVTSILRVKAKAALDAWKIEQAILASLTLPRIENESDQDFAKRVVTDSAEASKSAAEWGTKIHNHCECFHLTGDFDCDAETLPFVEGYRKWFNENITEVIEAEKVVVNQEYGFAGKVDLIAKHKTLGNVIIDLKTQRVKEKPAFYDEWAMQLAAYRLAYGREINLLSVVINSTKPDECASLAWESIDDKGGGRSYQAAFLNCLELWQFDKKYNPALTKEALAEIIEGNK